MKKFVIIALMLVTHFGLLAQTCPTGSYYLHSQTQVNSFPLIYPGCQEIPGDLNIGLGSGGPSNITDLTPLSQITGIAGNLQIVQTGLLQNLAGLENLEAIGQTLIIRNNSGLESLTGLDSLRSIGGELYVQDNTALTQLGALNQLLRSGQINIVNNFELQQLNGLNQLKFTDGISIQSNSNLTQLNAFAQLDTVGGNGFKLYQNANLTHLNAFNRLKVVDGNMEISNNGLLQLSGFDSLQHITFSILIAQNNALIDLTGLGSLDSIGVFGINVALNASLSSLEGLGNLKPFTNINIASNPSLTHLSGLNKIKSLGNLEINNNAGLLDLSGLDSLQEVHGYMGINGNAVLTNLHGLEALRRVPNSYLNVEQNPLLNNVEALQQLTDIHYLRFRSNAILDNLNGIQNMAELKALDLISNPMLSDFSGLPNLDSLEFLQLKDLPLLTNLDEFHNLQALRRLFLLENTQLSDLTGLLSVDSLSELNIVGNTQLTDCSVYPICDYLLHSVNAVIEGNATGCNSALEVAEGCGATTVYAAVWIDNNGDCQPDSADTPLPNIQVSLSGDIQLNVSPTQSDGWAVFGYLDSGAFELNLPNFPTSYWGLCQDSFIVDPIPGADSVSRYFLLQPINLCPELSVELGLPPAFRGCLVQTPMSVTVTNIGTATAEGVTVALVIPALLNIESVVPAPLGQSADTLFFALPDMLPFGVQTIQLMVRTSCDSLLLGESICLEAFGDISNPCTSGMPEFSEIRLFSQCVNDTMVRFLIKNVGNAPTQGAHDYVIIEDEIIMRTGSFALAPLASMTVDVSSDGSTYRMEATKFDNGLRTATVHENCGGFTPGMVTAFWFDQSLRNYDFDCREITLAYDPNRKSAIPTGIGPNNLIESNSPLEYTIEFQNTGTDTAFRVLLVDQLSPLLDLMTFRPGYASHPYTWAIRDSNQLEVLFFPIALPDSNVNEPASHGFFSFSIRQKPDLPEGTTLNNTASIIFDYNPPIVTNTVSHLIGQLEVNVDDPQPYANFWKLLGNPTRTSAIFNSAFEIEGEKRFELRDALGKTVRNTPFSGQRFVFQRGSLPAGVYFFAITDTEGRRFTGKIVVAD